MQYRKRDKNIIAKALNLLENADIAPNKQGRELYELLSQRTFLESVTGGADDIRYEFSNFNLEDFKIHVILLLKILIFPYLNYFSHTN